MAASTLSSTVQTKFPEVVMVACVLGFAFLAVELYLFDHYKEGSQIIGFAATLIGLLLSLLAFARARAVRTTVMVLFGVLTLVGAYGTLEHRETRQEDAAKFAQRQAQAKAAGTTQDTAQGAEGAPGAPREFRSNIPVLSPSA